MQRKGENEKLYQDWLPFSQLNIIFGLEAAKYKERRNVLNSLFCTSNEFWKMSSSVSYFFSYIGIFEKNMKSDIF